MKTIITLAAASLLMFSACKKSEIEDVKPMTVNTNSDLRPEAKLAASSNKDTESDVNNNGMNDENLGEPY